MTAIRLRSPDRSQPPTRSPGRREYALLDGLRALAALMVVGYHAQSSLTGTDYRWNPGLQLNMGVTVFFVLSGFLLYRPFVAARVAGRRAPTVGRYLTRRALRILPAYWVAITVFGLVLPGIVPVLNPDWPIFYTLAQTWVPYRMFDGLAPAWSLSVEASFYLLLPLYALLARRVLCRWPVRAQANTEFVVLGVVVVATVAARRVLFDRGSGPTGFLVWSVLGHADWFAAGLALALASVLWENAPRPPRWVRWVEEHPHGCWGAAALGFSAVGFVHGSPGDVVHVVSLAVAVLLVAPAVFGDERTGLVRRSLGARPMRWLGVVSFGIFLWNEPIASWIFARGWDDWGLLRGGLPVFLLTTAAAVALGAISYYLVERPAMALSRGRRRAERSNEGRRPRESVPATPAGPTRRERSTKSGKAESGGR